MATRLRKHILDLDPVTELDGTEQFPLETNGGTKRVSGDVIALFASSGAGAPFSGDYNDLTNKPTLGTAAAAATTDFLAAGGTAVAATILATGRTINGVAFNGSANITVAAAAGTLTGSALAAGVTASSLTSAAGGAFGTAAFTASSAYATAAQGATADAALAKSANLSDLTNAGTARTNLGLGTAATEASSAFDAAGAADAAVSTFASGLGSAAFHPASDFESTGVALVKSANLSDLANAATARSNLGLVAIAASGSASDLGTGTLPIARIADGAVTLAKLADVATARFFGRVTAGTGVPEVLTAAQVKTALAIAYSDVSGTPTLAAIATSGSASDLTTGTVPAARLPNPSASTLGGVQSAATVSNQWINSISTSGVPALSQPAFSNLSGSVAASQMPALTGDVTTSAGAVATTLATVNSNVGSFGSTTKSATVTVNGKGLVTAASEATLTPAVGSITGLGTGVGTALAVNVGSAGAFVVLGGALGTPSSGVGTNLTGTASGLTAGNVTTNANLTGNVTSVGNATTLATITGAVAQGIGARITTTPNETYDLWTSQVATSHYTNASITVATGKKNDVYRADLLFSPQGTGIGSYIRPNLTADSASASGSAVYAVIAEGKNQGPGTVKAIYGRGWGNSTALSSSVVVGLVGAVTVDSGYDGTSWALEVSHTGHAQEMIRMEGATNDMCDVGIHMASGTQMQSAAIQYDQNATSAPAAFLKMFNGPGSLIFSVDNTAAISAKSLALASGTFSITGSLTLGALGKASGVAATINNTASSVFGISTRGTTFSGSGNAPTGTDMAPTFAPSASIAIAQGASIAAFASPAVGVTITDLYGGNAALVYSNTAGAVTNGTTLNVGAPIVLGSLKPTTQYGIHVINQGTVGATTAYGLYIDSQFGAASNYQLALAGSSSGFTAIAAAAAASGTAILPAAGGTLATLAGAETLTTKTLTDPIITNIAPGADFTVSQNSVAALTSVSSGAIVNTLYLKTGFVGIGTTAPDSQLTISGNATAPPAFSGSIIHMVAANATSGILSFDCFAGNGTMAFRRANNTNASPTTLATNDIIGQFGFRGHDGTAYSTGNAATIRAVAANTWTTSDHSTYITLSTTPVGSITVAERMRIAAGGDVVIGTAAIATNATLGFPWIPSCAGTPTGAPTAPYSNAAALIVDTTNSKLYALVGATWKSVTLA